ncbi:MAG: hypothetical protein Q8K99_07065, partial [Actinomycetota bacterium]|nr:hypothetical protein [Actinomycetota bacterium]
AGVKDLMGGRHRVVGLLSGGGERSEDAYDLSVWVLEPWPGSYPWAPRLVVALDDPEGLVDVDGELLDMQEYVAVEGVLSAGAQRLLVEHFEPVPTP